VFLRSIPRLANKKSGYLVFNRGRCYIIAEQKTYYLYHEKLNDLEIEAKKFLIDKINGD